MVSLDDLRRIYRELGKKGVDLAGVGDARHIAWVYLIDPDGNEIEVFYELPPGQWRVGPMFGGRFPGSLEDE